MPKEKPETEQPKIEKEEKLPHEIELEQRPMPQKGEAYRDWLKRIGGPNVEIVKKIEEYSPPRMKKDRPFMIDKEGTFVFNDENIKEFYSAADRKKIDKWTEEGTPHISKERINYRLEKELFNQNPELYFKALVGALKRNHQIVADKRFNKSVGEWLEELEEGPLSAKATEGKKEKPKKREKKTKERTKEEKKEGPKKKPEKKPEKKPRKEKIESKKEEKLDQARVKFIEAEKEYNRYGKGKWWSREIGTFFKGKEGGVRVREEYEKAMQEYEKARAEHVADHLDKFIDERMKIADGRAEKFEKSRWRKVWDWMGNQNLEKLGWKPKNKVGKFLARGINMRTGVSLGLLGTGIGFGMGSAVGVGALIARRVYGGVATGMGSYELLKMGTERYPRATDKKLEALDLDKIDNIMAKYEMRAKLKGQKVSENENYQKIKDRYLELLKSESEKADKKLDVLMKAADERLEEMESKLKRGDIYRKITAAGIGAVVGASLLNRLINRVGVAAEMLVETEKLPDKFVEAVQQNEGYIHEARKALTTYMHEAGKPELGNLTGAQRVWAEDRLWDLYQQANPGAAEKVLHVGDTVDFGRTHVEQVINEVQERFASPEKLSRLSENLKDYVDNVKWDRYSVIHHPQMGEVYGWELDEGVRAVDWQQEVAGLKELEPIMPEPPKTGLVGMEEPLREVEKSIEPIEPAEPAPIEPIEEEFGISAQSRLEQFNEIGDRAISERICDKYNLLPEAYNTIKDIPVRRFVNEFNYYRPPAYMMYRRASSLEIWGKILLRNVIRELFLGRSLYPRHVNTSVDAYLNLVGRMGEGRY